MKNLKTLEKQYGILISESYGVKLEGVEKLWRFFLVPNEKYPKRIQEEIFKERGIDPKSSKVHKNTYLHEKACSEIFVSLALTGRLLEWKGEGDQKQGFRHDRLFRIDDRTFYVELETGSQDKTDWREKVRAYQKLYNETRKPFHVLFVMPDEETLEELIEVFYELNTTPHYRACVFSEFVENPLTAQLTSSTDTIFLL
jgi:hypothetical protein